MSYELLNNRKINKIPRTNKLILIILIILNIIILSISIVNFIYIYKVTPLLDSINDIRKHSQLNNETLIIDTINKLPFIINTICKVLKC